MAPDVRCPRRSLPGLPRARTWKPRFAPPRPGSAPRSRQRTASVLGTAMGRSLIFLGFIRLSIALWRVLTPSRVTVGYASMARAEFIKLGGFFDRQTQETATGGGCRRR